MKILKIFQNSNNEIFHIIWKISNLEKIEYFEQNIQDASTKTFFAELRA